MDGPPTYDFPPPLLTGSQQLGVVLGWIVLTGDQKQNPHSKLRDSSAALLSADRQTDGPVGTWRFRRAPNYLIGGPICGLDWWFGNSNPGSWQVC